MTVKSTLSGLLLLALLSGCEKPGVTVEQAWIREAPPGASALAGYFTLKNGSDHEIRLKDANASGFGMTMFHRTVIRNEVASMEHENAVTVPPHGSLEFAPGGRHLMLMNPKKPYQAGDRVDITFDLEDGTQLPVKFEVKKAE